MRSSHLLLGNPGDGVVEDPASVQRAHAATGAPGGHAAHHLLLKSHEHVMELFHAAGKLKKKKKFRRCANADAVGELMFTVGDAAGWNNQVFTVMNEHLHGFLTHFLWMSVGIRSCCSSLP